jgi:hypothetical protein
MSPRATAADRLKIAFTQKAGTALSGVANGKVSAFTGGMTPKTTTHATTMRKAAETRRELLQNLRLMCMTASKRA